MMLKRLPQNLVHILFVTCVTSCGAESSAQGEVGYPGKLWITVSELQTLVLRPLEKAELGRRSRQISVPDLFRRNENADTALLGGTYLAFIDEDLDQQAKLRDTCTELIGREIGAVDGLGDGESLALARNLPAVLISCKLLGMAADPEFVAWVEALDDRVLGAQERSLRSTHEHRANNWGTHAGAARASRAAFLDDPDAMAEVAQVFSAWVGESGRAWPFRFGDDLSWHSDDPPSRGINPALAVKDGHSLDGVLPDDQRRGGEFRWPPPKEPYVWEALQGATVTAQILHDNGYPAWEWGDQALLRAVLWLLHECKFRPEGDDLWMLALIDRNYGTQFTSRLEQATAKPGKNMGFTGVSHLIKLHVQQQP